MHYVSKLFFGDTSKRQKGKLETYYIIDVAEAEKLFEPESWKNKPKTGMFDY